MLPEFNSEGDLPSGVHTTGWHEFQSRFGLATARRVWLLRANCAASSQQCVANLRRILLEARKVHSAKDYLRLSEPILLEVQQREQEILEY